MFIAIISDIHDNIPNLKKVLNYCATNKIEKIICCGDLATIETLDFLNDNFSGEIFFAFGNMDAEHVAKHPFANGRYKHTEIFSNFGETEINGKKIAFVHFPKEAEQLCKSGKYDFVFHGHTHKPWSSEAFLTTEASAEVVAKETLDPKKCTMLNPGNVANQYYPPTFAVWNTNDNIFQLIRINELS